MLSGVGIFHLYCELQNIDLAKSATFPVQIDSKSVLNEYEIQLCKHSPNLILNCLRDAYRVNIYRFSHKDLYNDIIFCNKLFVLRFFVSLLVGSIR